MLKDYPIKIENTAIPFPLEMTESYETVEDVVTSEAGTDMINVIRTRKLSLAITMRVSSTWKSFFDLMSARLLPITLSLYDTSTHAYLTHSVRMRDYSSSLVRHSEDLAISDGVYDVTFNLLEI